MLRKVVATIAKTRGFGVSRRAINPQIRVVGHNELANTQCPGVVLSDVLKES